MNETIIVPPNTIHTVKRPMMPVEPLYKLIRFAYENDLRYGQSLCLALGITDPVLFYIENREVERLIKEYIANEKDSAQ